MKNSIKTIAVLFLTIFAISCSKDDDPAPPESNILEYTVNAESIANGTSPTNKCFINLYDGLLYNKAEAIANSNKVDFAYNYHGGGCSNCRFFENVTNMSTRTGYVSSFSTITNSQIAATDITAAEFDALKTSTDINILFTANNITSLTGIADVTNRITDVATTIVFAFKDKNNKAGFFKIGNYVANVPDNDKAILTIEVKIIK